MKKFIAYITMAGYLFIQCTGYATSDSANYETAQIYYQGIVDAYNRTGPQGLLDASRIKFEPKDRQFIVSKLQSKQQSFPLLPEITLNDKKDTFLIKLSENETLQLKMLDQYKGTFEIGGQRFQFNPRDTFSNNYKAIEKAVKQYQAEKRIKAEAPTASNIFKFLENKVALYLDNLIIPQAHAQSLMVWAIIAVVVIAALFIVYNMGKNAGVDQQRTNDTAKISSAQSSYSSAAASQVSALANQAHVTFVAPTATDPTGGGVAIPSTVPTITQGTGTL